MPRNRDSYLQMDDYFDRPVLRQEKTSLDDFDRRLLIGMYPGINHEGDEISPKGGHKVD